MKVALTGGGTLGHVIPALSVWDEIVRICPDATAFYIGSTRERDRLTVKKAGLAYHAVSTGKLRRYFSPENLADVFRTAAGFFQARSVLAREKPDVLFSKGGYVSVPVVLAAASLGIRIVTHESDSSLGLANRINSRFASRVCLGLAAASEGGRFIHTGNPVRRDVVMAAGTAAQEDDFILVLGGSQGAREVNELVYASLDRLLEHHRVYHQCGSGGDFSIRRDGYTQTEFIGEDLPVLMARAALVVSRAGAGTLSELAAMGRASVLVPLRKASRGDQVENAEFMHSCGAAVVYNEGDDLAALVSGVTENTCMRLDMERRAHALYVPDAARRIANIVLGSD